ncbi:hypothetical protein SOVF_047250 [Spinacia oleracea]|nr:hypothetical protein SOVF_047250 [Spinacia oleracea]
MLNLFFKNHCLFFTTTASRCELSQKSTYARPLDFPVCKAPRYIIVPAQVLA